MLWSLLKILFFVVLIAAVSMGAGLLLDDGTTLRMAFGNYELNLGPLQAAILMLLLVGSVWLTLKIAGLLVAIIRFISGDETAITRYFQRNRERKGFQAIAESLTALASGEGREALSKAARAERFLNRPELTNLLKAQAAEMAGDRKKAEAVYKQLLSDQRTRFVGVRGIMKQKLGEGARDTALKLAEKAHDLKPTHEETQDILLQLQAEHADWTGARRTLNAKLKTGMLPRDVHRRRDAVLALSQAHEGAQNGAAAQARDTAIEANRLSPHLVPAAVMAARAHIEQGKPRYATRVLRKAWEAGPHPDLAATFAEIAPDETPQARIKRFTKLTSGTQDHPETRMLQAELQIAAEDFPAARRALGDLAETDPTARSLTLMAAIERGAGAEDATVRAWLTRALTAPRGPQWICENCGTIHAQWVPVCENCDSFDTLAWKAPATSEIAMPPSTGLLPLIVGSIEDQGDADPAEEASADKAPASEASAPETDAPLAPDAPAQKEERPQTDTPEDALRASTGR